LFPAGARAILACELPVFVGDPEYGVKLAV
jgi:hypothetical protein